MNIIHSKIRGIGSTLIGSIKTKLFRTGERFLLCSKLPGKDTFEISSDVFSRVESAQCNRNVGSITRQLFLYLFVIFSIYVFFLFIK